MAANWTADGAARKELAEGDADAGPRDDPHRHGQPVLWRAGRRAHEARPDAARSRGGARLLLRQHPQLALLRRGRHDRTSTTAATRGIDGTMVEGAVASRDSSRRRRRPTAKRADARHGRRRSPTLQGRSRTPPTAADGLRPDDRPRQCRGQQDGRQAVRRAGRPDPLDRGAWSRRSGSRSSSRAPTASTIRRPSRPSRRAGIGRVRRPT